MFSCNDFLNVSWKTSVWYSGAFFRLICVVAHQLAARRAERWRGDVEAGSRSVHRIRNLFLYVNVKPRTSLPPEQEMNRSNNVLALDVEMKYWF